MYNRGLREPFLFNPLKHHLGYIRKFIRDYRSEIQCLRSDLSDIGNSQMDVYSGTLSIRDLTEEIIYYLSTCLSVDKDLYIKLINEYKGYFVIALSDHSKWVLRIGYPPNRYIHFHPARKSPYSFRITANTLKTLIAASIISNNYIGLNDINLARQQVLGLGPIKRLSRTQGIGKYTARYF